MVLWHNTEDAPRSPEQVLAGQSVDLKIGTYPIEPGQLVSVSLNITHADGRQGSFTVDAQWQYNHVTKGNSYWLASLDPLEAGDEVSYVIRGISQDGETSRQEFAFTVEADE